MSGERQFGPYRLVHQIAVGGMAEIHLAKTNGLAGFEKYVALKMIHPNFSSDDQFVQMLIDEAKITVQLQHVNIAQTFDLGRVDKTYYITMEYVDGCDLYELLRRSSERQIDFPVDLAAFIGKEVATGLDYAHRKRDVTGEPLHIVHRDVSPQNVLLSYAGEIKIVDFGIAKATMRARQTAAGVIKGKYYYMSPEQAWGEKVDHRTDIFSAGILLYEMLTGQMLYLEEDLQRLLDRVRKAEIPPPSTVRPVPRRLEQIVMRALAKRPDDRFRRAGELATELERFLHAYSPVFTAAKLSAFMREVLGERTMPPREDRASSTGPARPPPRASEDSDSGTPRVTRRITHDMLVHARSEYRDENSVIFRVGELGRSATPAGHDDETTTALPPPRSTPRQVGDATRRVANSAGDDTGSTLRRPLAGPGQRLAEAYELAEPTRIDDPIRAAPGGHGGRSGTSDDEPTRIDFNLASADDLDAAATRRLPGRAALDTLGEGEALEEGHTRPLPEEDRRHASSSWPVPARRGTEERTGATTIAEPPITAPTSPPLRPRVVSGPTPAGGGPRLTLTGSSAGLPFDDTAEAAGAETGGPPAPAPAITEPERAAPIAGPQATDRIGRLDRDELARQPASAGPGLRRIDRRLLWGSSAAVACGIAAVLVAGGGEAPAPAAAIEIVSIPAGARATVNGVVLPQTTPTRLSGALPGQTYRIHVALAGYQPWQRELHAPVAGTEITVVAALKQIVVALQVDSQPQGAEVFLNGSSVGRTPLVLPHLDPGRAETVELRLKGYRPVRRKLHWGDATRLEIAVTLEK
jgi:serine/threonine protein kinase